MFGVKDKSEKSKLPLKFTGTALLKPIKYFEDKGSAKIKTCIISSAINTPG